MNRTKIEYGHYTWNPVIGCSRGCPYCWARLQAKRQKHRCTECYRFTPHFHRERLNEPMKVKKPSRILVSFMGEIFSKGWKDWITPIFQVMKQCPQHQFLILTKETPPDICYPGNVWLGVSLDRSETVKERMRGLFELEDVKMNHILPWLSIEPILEEIDPVEWEYDPYWVVLGAETGRRKDRVVPRLSWTLKIFSRCTRHLIPLFMKNNLRSVWGSAPLIQEYPMPTREEAY